jgi:hypothetical protein
VLLAEFRRFLERDLYASRRELYEILNPAEK